MHSIVNILPPPLSTLKVVILRLEQLERKASVRFVSSVTSTASGVAFHVALDDTVFGHCV